MVWTGKRMLLVRFVPGDRSSPGAIPIAIEDRTWALFRGCDRGDRWYCCENGWWCVAHIRYLLFC